MSSPHLPPKPSLPLALFALIGTYTGIRITICAGLQGIGFALLAILLFLILGAPGIYFIQTARRGRKKDGKFHCWEFSLLQKPFIQRIFFFLVALNLGFLLANIALMQQSYAIATLENTPVSKLSIEVIQDSSQTQYGFMSQGRISYENRSLGTCMLSSSDSLKRGESIIGVGQFRLFDESEYGISSLQRGLLGTIALTHISQHLPSSTIMSFFANVQKEIGSLFGDTQAGVLLKAMIVGDKTGLKELGLDETFSNVGVAHIIAVSGAHLAIVALFLTTLTQKLKLLPKQRFCILAVMIGAYVVICGLPVSALRAWCMWLACWGSRFMWRRDSSVAGVSAVGCAFLAINPFCAFDMGYLLSVLSVLALALFGSYAYYFCNCCIPKVPCRVSHVIQKPISTVRLFLVESFSASLLCALATLGVVVATFGKVSTIGPLSNLLIAPLFSPVMLMGLLSVLTAAIPFLGFLLHSTALFFSQIIISLVAALSHIPGSVIFFDISLNGALVITLIFFSVLYVLWPKIKKFTVMATMGSLCVAFFAISFLGLLLTPPRFIVFDVGQGDAILLQDSYHTFLVDTGVDESCVRQLQHFGISKLDGVLITHQHTDHYGGLAYMQGCVAINQLFIARGVEDSYVDELREDIEKLNLEVTEVDAGDEFFLGSWSLRVLWPKSIVDGLENKDSICLKAQLVEQNFSLLLTGDSEEDELAQYISLLEPIDVLKVGHHGSAVSINQEEANYLRPTLSIASAGQNNRYGHPKQECIDVLTQAGSYFLCTKDVGNVEVEPCATMLRLHCTKLREGDVL